MVAGRSPSTPFPCSAIAAHLSLLRKLSDTCVDEPPHENRWWHASSCSQHLRVKNPASLYHSPYRSRIIDIGERISIQQDDVR